ncbi:hypothetical protein F511_12585 [Dorcoceras hygrometricum]|uniref:CCHC-type domain-containing protein n=1 Tax=Dorcoceras hygrometricum TaxID=472368 RepID=A0A2Z7AEJ8_9LAMI|nr:hypothetical protein F511_12585 [Dorcoceras hygrometricum]
MIRFECWPALGDQCRFGGEDHVVARYSRHATYRALDFFDSHAIYVAMLELFSHGAVQCGITTIECIWRVRFPRLFRCRGDDPAGDVPGEMPPRRRDRASRQAVVDSRTLVSIDREDASQPSVPLRSHASQSSAFRSLSCAVNREIDFMESLTIGQTQVQQPSGQSVDPVSSGTSSSQPSVASQSWSRRRFRPRGRHFKRSSSSSLSSGGSSGARPTAAFCGQCGGRHRPSQCVGVLGACNNCGQVGHFARVCPTLGQRDLTRSSSRRPYRPFQSQRSVFQPPEASGVRELSLSEQSGLQPTHVDAKTEERDDVLTGGGCTAVELRVLSYPVQLSCCSHALFLLFVSYRDARASGDTALSSPCWDPLATMRRVVNYHSSCV